MVAIGLKHQHMVYMMNGISLYFANGINIDQHLPNYGDVTGLNHRSIWDIECIINGNTMDIVINRG